MDVVAIDQFVNEHALFANGVQKCGRVSGKDFANRGVTQHGVKSPDACAQVVWRSSSASVLNRLNRLAHTVNRVANGVGKVAVE